MFAIIAQNLPLVTLATLALVSVHTIGYFTRIGTHFIGLIDFSNLVYSFALAILGLVLAIEVGVFAYLFLGRILNIDAAWRRVLALGNFVFPIAALIVLYASTEDRLPERFRFLSINLDVAFMLSTLLAFTWTYVAAIVDFVRLRQRFRERMLILLCIGAMFFAFSSGRALAWYNAFGTPQLYQITDKNGFEFTVRIVRTSSAGFIVSRDDRIVFYPKEQIRKIEGDALGETFK